MNARKSRKSLLLTALLLVLALVLALWFVRAPLSLAIAQRIAHQHLSSTGLEGLPDGLHLGLCGAGSPFPDEQRAGPCTVVIAGERLLVFDAGNGAARNLGKMGFSLGRVSTVFLTHFHSDHIDGLGELMLQRWVQGAHREPLPIYGPTGVESIVSGLMQAYQQDRNYRVAHHGDAFVPASGFGGQARPFAVPGNEPVTVLDDGDLKVTAFAVDHAPVHPALGYRISYRGRVVVLSGDTKASPVVAQMARGADLLVHEALSPRLVGLMQDTAAQAGRTNLAKLLKDIVDYHSTPEEAAEVARQAGVRFLLLNHIVPTLPPLPGMEQVFLGRAGEIFDGPLRVGKDGDWLSLPAGEQRIDVRRRF